ncbi:hypothetical protein Tco_0454144 [Tanacetum coccineum]
MQSVMLVKKVKKFGRVSKEGNIVKWTKEGVLKLITDSKVNTGSIELYTVIEQAICGENKGQREGKAPIAQIGFLKGEEEAGANTFGCSSSTRIIAEEEELTACATKEKQKLKNSNEIDMVWMGLEDKLREMVYGTMNEDAIDCLKMMEDKSIRKYLKCVGVESLALKDDLRKLKGKALVDNDVTKHPSDLEMLKIDVEPITPKLLNNKTAHSAYIKHTQEEVTVLKDLVEHVKSKYPLDQSLESAYKNKPVYYCTSGSQPSGNTKKDKIQQTPSNTQMNKVEAHPRKVKSNLKNKDYVVEPKGIAHMQHSKLNAEL